MTEPWASRTEIQRIRRLFAHAHPSYSVAECAALLGVPAPAIQHQLDEGAITALRFGGELRISWTDVVWLGLISRWTYRMLSMAVRGRRAAGLLPRLVRVVPGTLELPRYQWQVLTMLAAERRRDEGRMWNASDLVEEAISNFIVPCIDNWPALETAAPGLRAASEWPGRDAEGQSL